MLSTSSEFFFLPIYIIVSAQRAKLTPFPPPKKKQKKYPQNSRLDWIALLLLGLAVRVLSLSLSLFVRVIYMLHVLIYPVFFCVCAHYIRDE
jgi:putative Mn2+ efflux pump MntP